MFIIASKSVLYTRFVIVTRTSFSSSKGSSIFTMQNTFLSLLVIFIFQASLLSNAYLQRFSMISKKVVSQSLKRSQKLFQTTNDWTEELISTTAFKACQIAGLKILEGSNTISLQDDIISKIGSRDIVTKVDMEVQEVIKDSILSIFPNHKFLGEEDVLPGRDESTKATENCMASKPTSLWICDPIDGTTNFAHGMPLSGIILAFVSNGELVYGMIYDPFRNETFSAWKGKGAYLDGKRIQCCKTSLLKDAIVCTGSPPNLSSLNACLRATNLISKDVRTMRMLGSASHMTSWLACGRVTAYFEADLNVWDVAAGALIISEAGGRVTDVHGNPFSLLTRNVVMTNGLIHDELLTKLQEARMWIE